MHIDKISGDGVVCRNDLGPDRFQCNVQWWVFCNGWCNCTQFFFTATIKLSFFQPFYSHSCINLSLYLENVRQCLLVLHVCTNITILLEVTSTGVHHLEMTPFWNVSNILGWKGLLFLHSFTRFQIACARLSFHHAEMKWTTCHSFNGVGAHVTWPS